MQVGKLTLAPVKAFELDKLSQGNEVEKGASFGQMLNDALTKVNDLQVNSQNQTMKMASGQIEDVSQVMIAAEKASISLQLTMQIRNKAVEAYQEIMRMQV